MSHETGPALLPECPRCAAMDAALSEPGTRFFRTADGDLVVVSVEADDDEVSRMIAEQSAVELLPAHEERNP